MNEQEIRALVRDAIARHMSGRTVDASHPASSHLSPSHLRTLAPSNDFSHGLFVLPTGSDSEGPCIIEPSVMCNHCGYCKSYGH
jgi:hypothetical protein